MYEEQPQPIVMEGCAEHTKSYVFGCAGCYRKMRDDLLHAYLSLGHFKRACAFYANGKHFIKRECGHDTILDDGQAARTAFSVDLMDE